MRCIAVALALACAPAAPRAVHLSVTRHEGSVRAIVHANVEGAPIDLLVDTGAVSSIVPMGFVLQHRLPLRHFDAPEQVEDVNGRRVSMLTLAHARVRLEGDVAEESLDFLVNPGDRSTGPGILAPQDLLRRGQAMVVDLRRDELRYEPEEVALRRAPLSRVEYRRCLVEGFFSSNHRIVEIPIDGVPAAMVLDTGAERTVLTRNNPALPTMPRRRSSSSEVDALVSTSDGLLVEGISVEFANAPYSLQALLLPVNPSCAQGLLGADVISRCTLVWGSSNLWASCD